MVNIMYISDEMLCTKIVGTGFQKRVRGKVRGNLKLSMRKKWRNLIDKFRGSSWCVRERGKIVGI